MDFVREFGKEKILKRFNEGILQRKGNTDEHIAFDVIIDSNDLSDYTLLFESELAAFRQREGWLNAGCPVETSAGWSSNLNCYYVSINKNVEETKHYPFTWKK